MLVKCFFGDWSCKMCFAEGGSLRIVVLKGRAAWKRWVRADGVRLVHLGFGDQQRWKL